MFISNDEKEIIRISVRTLQEKVKELEERIDRLSSTVTKIKPPILRTAEAPWGYKMDGTPKKRPGRSKPVPFDIPVL
jgi:tetrahydromethanopterin S-methyltransferase subunit B